MTVGHFAIIALLGIVVTAFGFIGMKTSPVSDNSRAPKELRQAALHVLSPQFHASGVGVEIGSTTQDSINRELALIEKYKSWADTQETDIRRAYYYWLDHFENQARSAQRAIDNGAREKWKAKSQKSRDEYERTSAFAKTIPRPQ